MGKSFNFASNHIYLSDIYLYFAYGRVTEWSSQCCPFNLLLQIILSNLHHKSIVNNWYSLKDNSDESVIEFIGQALAITETI